MKPLPPILCGILLFLTGCSADEFDAGRTAVTQGNYSLGIERLEAYLTDHPGGQHASRAQFFIAKAHLGLGELEKSRSAFEATLTDYPGSLEAHKSRYKIAMIALVKGDRAGALAGFRQLAEAPDGPLAPEAAMMVDYLETSE